MGKKVSKADYSEIAETYDVVREVWDKIWTSGWALLGGMWRFMLLGILRR